MGKERKCRLSGPAHSPGKRNDHPGSIKSAFAPLFEMEERMNHICDNMGDADEDQMNAMMEELEPSRTF